MGEIISDEHQKHQSSFPIFMRRFSRFGVVTLTVGAFALGGIGIWLTQSSRVQSLPLVFIDSPLITTDSRSPGSISTASVTTHPTSSEFSVTYKTPTVASIKTSYFSEQIGQDTTPTTAQSSTSSTEASPTTAQSSTSSTEASPTTDQSGSTSSTEATTNTTQEETTPATRSRTVLEGDDLVLSVSISRANQSDLLVPLCVTDIDAEKNTDYLIPESVTIPAGSTSVQFRVRSIFDDLTEGDESFTISVDVVDGCDTTREGAVITVLILDDNVRVDMTLGFDDPTGVIGSNQREATIYEGDSQRLIASIPAALATDLVIPISATNIDTDTDYHIPESITIPAGSTSTQFHIQAISDTLSEGEERLTVKLEPVTGYRATHVLAELTVKIADEDRPLLSIEPVGQVGGTLPGGSSRTAEVTENGAVSLSVSISEAQTSNLLVPLRASDIDTESTSDYQVPTQVIILAGSTQTNFEVRANSDRLVEGTESFVVSLEPVVGFRTNHDNAMLTLNIIDRDRARLTLKMEGARFSESSENSRNGFIYEGESVNFVVGIDRMVETDLDIRFALLPEGITDPDVRADANLEITIPARTPPSDNVGSVQFSTREDRQMNESGNDGVEVKTGSFFFDSKFDDAIDAGDPVQLTVRDSIWVNEGIGEDRPFRLGGLAIRDFTLDENDKKIWKNNTNLVGVEATPVDEDWFEEVSAGFRVSGRTLIYDGPTLSYEQFDPIQPGLVLTLQYQSLRTTVDDFFVSTHLVLRDIAEPGRVTLDTSGVYTTTPTNTVIATLFDEDGGDVGATWWWQVANEASGEEELSWTPRSQVIAGFRTNQIDLESSDVGKWIRVAVFYDDKFLVGTFRSWLYSDPVFIAASDAVGAIALSDTTPAVGETVNATLTETDTLISEVSWQWQSAAVPEAGETAVWGDIEGATRASYLVEVSQDGRQIRAMATYTDRVGTTTDTATSDPSDAVTEATAGTEYDAVVTLTLPEVLEAGETVSAVLEDANGVVSITSWTWQRALSATPTIWNDISGANQSSYRLTTSDSDNKVRVQVVYNDGGTSDETANSQELTIIQDYPGPVRRAQVVGSQLKFNGTAGTNSGSVTWSAPNRGGQPDGYRVYCARPCKDGSKGPFVFAANDTLSHPLNQLRPSAAHQITIVAYNERGESSPIKLSFVTPPAVNPDQVKRLNLGLESGGNILFHRLTDVVLEVTEGDTDKFSLSLQTCATRSEAVTCTDATLEEDIAVNIRVSNQSAIEGEDFTTVPETMMITAGNNSATYDVTFTQDDLHEGAETFVVEMIPTATLAALPGARLIVVILDDEQASLSAAIDGERTLSRTGYQPEIITSDGVVAEGEEIFFTVSLDETLPFAVDASLLVREVGATTNLKRVDWTIPANQANYDRRFSFTPRQDLLVGEGVDGTVALEAVIEIGEEDSPYVLGGDAATFSVIDTIWVNEGKGANNRLHLSGLKTVQDEVTYDRLTGISSPYFNSEEIEVTQIAQGWSVVGGELFYSGPPLDYESFAAADAANPGFDLELTFEGSSAADDPAEVTVPLRLVDVAEEGRIELSTLHPTEGQTLTATLIDPDADREDVVWKWQQNDFSTSSKPWTDIAVTADNGANTNAYKVDPATEGIWLRAVVTYSDRFGTIDPFRPLRSSWVKVGAAPPTDRPGSVSISPIPTVTQQLLTATLSDPDAEPFGVEWEWEVADIPVPGVEPNWTPIPDTNSRQFTPPGYFDGQLIRVTVSYRDGVGRETKTAVSVASVPLSTAVTEVQLVNAIAGVGVTLVGFVSDPDAPLTAVSWEWQIADGPQGPWTAISGAEGSLSTTTEQVNPAQVITRYTPDTADVGKYLRLQMGYTDALGITFENIVSEILGPVLSSGWEFVPVGDCSGSVHEGTQLICSYRLAGISTGTFPVVSLAGTDSALATLTHTGTNNYRLEFNSPTSHQTPTDSDQDNVYEFQLMAVQSDTTVATLAQSITVVASSTPDTPIPPTVTIDQSNPQAVTVSWTPPNPNASNVGPLVYQLQHRLASGSPPPEWTDYSVSRIPSNSVLLEDLMADTRYEVRVRAGNRDQFCTDLPPSECTGWGGWSSPTEFVTTGTINTMAAPTVSNITTSSMWVSWTAPTATSLTIDGYRVRWAVSGPNPTWTTSHDIEAALTSYNLTGLEENTQYLIQVLAFHLNIEGEWSASAMVATPAAVNTIDTPTAPQVFPGGTTSLLVMWVAPSSLGRPIEGFRVRWAEDAASPVWTVSPDFGPTVLEHELTGLEVDSDYVVAVQAFNQLFTTGWSAPTSISTLAEGESFIAPPTAPSLEVASSTSLTITWTAPFSAGGAIEGYRYRWAVATDSPVWTTSSDFGATVLSHTLSGLTPETDYVVQIQAFNQSFTSEWSASAEQSTIQIPDSIDTPAAPTIAVASSTSLLISWVAPSFTGTPIGGFRYRWAVDVASPVWTVSADFGATELSHTLAGLDTDTVYVVQVQAFNQSVSSDWSASTSQTTSATVVDTIATPGAPALSEITTSSLTVSWTAPAVTGRGIEGFRYRWAVDVASPVWTVSADFGATVLSHSLTGLNADTSYVVAVQAFNQSVTSDWSTAAQATTLSSTSPGPGPGPDPGPGPGGSPGPLPLPGLTPVPLPGPGVSLSPTPVLIPGFTPVVAPAIDVYTDDGNSVHQSNIDQLASLGIVRGCNPPENTLFCPERSLSRGEMATLMVRAFALPATEQDFFVDDNLTTHEPNINRLAAAELTVGCNPSMGGDRYCPDDQVSRAEVASLLARLIPLTEELDDFEDTADSIHARTIRLFRATGIIIGCNPPFNTNYCPDRPITRAEVSTFLLNFLIIYQAFNSN